MKQMDSIFDEIPVVKKSIEEYIERIEKHLKIIRKPVIRAEKLFGEHDQSDGVCGWRVED
jgi:hypothetical protein